MNADAMNLPYMLRGYDIIFDNDADTDHASGPDIGPELAALVEAADAMLNKTRDGNMGVRRAVYMEARAALVAKIGGKG